MHWKDCLYSILTHYTSVSLISDAHSLICWISLRFFLCWLRRFSGYGKEKMAMWKYQAKVQIKLFIFIWVCVFSVDYLHVFISSHFHSVTQYVPQNTFVCNRDQCSLFLSRSVSFSLSISPFLCLSFSLSPIILSLFLCNYLDVG